MTRFLWVAAIVFSGLTLFMSRSVGIDFKTFYAVGGMPGDLYSQAAQDKVVPIVDGHHLYYFHPPQEALLFRPLSHLPLRAAFYVWDVLMLGCVVLSVVLLRREIDFPVVAAFALPFPMALLWIGQDSALILLITVLAFLRYRKSDEFSAGLILSLALIKPQFAVPIVLVLPRWKFWLGFAVGSVAFALSGLWMVGVEGIKEMLALGRIESGYEMLHRNTNLHGLLRDYPVVVIALSVALVLWAAFFKADREKKFCIAVMVCQLVSYHGHLCDMLPLIIPIAVMGSLWLVAAFALLFPVMMALDGYPSGFFALPVIVALIRSMMPEKKQSLDVKLA